MRPFFVFIMSVVFFQFIAAQPVLKHDTHALLPGTDNPMMLCKFVNPGINGNNLLWDFSKLETIEKFTGTITDIYESKNFPEANVDLEEFGTHFYFISDQNSINQIGYSSKDNKTIVKYNQPYEKMIFPLSYREAHSSIFSGNYEFDGKDIGTMNGEGLIEADAWGTIILPNNSVYQNTIRVKSVKSYTLSYGGESIQEVEIITYRWYNSFHRYPLLVLTEYTTKCGSNTCTNYQAAYNNNAISENFKSATEEDALVIFPNPADVELYLNYSSNSKQIVNISIFDVSGKLVFENQELEIFPGDNNIPIALETSKFKPGTYLLKFATSEKTISKEIIITD